MPKECIGLDPQQPCRFSRDNKSKKAQPPSGKKQCLFCDPNRSQIFEEKKSNDSFNRKVVAALQAFQTDPNTGVFAEAVARLGQHAAFYVNMADHAAAPVRKYCEGAEGTACCFSTVTFDACGRWRSQTLVFAL